MARDVAVKCIAGNNISQATAIVLTGGRTAGNIYETDRLRSQVAASGSNPLTDVQLASQYGHKFKGVS